MKGLFFAAAKCHAKWKCFIGHMDIDDLQKYVVDERNSEYSHDKEKNLGFWFLVTAVESDWEDTIT